MVFVSVLIGMVVCCLCSCVMKRIQIHFEGDGTRARNRRALMAGLAAGEGRGPGRAETTRADVFRNSLHESGEEDWDCPLCGFGNRPRCFHCNLCGMDKDKVLLDRDRVAQCQRQVMLAAFSSSPLQQGASATTAKPGTVSAAAAAAAALKTGPTQTFSMKLSDRQLRGARRLLWRRELRRHAPSLPPRSKAAKARVKAAYRVDSGHGTFAVQLPPRDSSLDSWRWRRNDPPPPPPAVSESGVEDKLAAFNKAAADGHWEYHDGADSSQETDFDDDEDDDEEATGRGGRGGSKSSSGFLGFFSSSTPNSKNKKRSAATTTTTAATATATQQQQLREPLLLPDMLPQDAVESKTSPKQHAPLDRSSSSGSSNGSGSFVATAASFLFSSSNSQSTVVGVNASATQSSPPRTPSTVWSNPELDAVLKFAAVAVPCEADCISWVPVGDEDSDDDDDDDEDKEEEEEEDEEDENAEEVNSEDSDEDVEKGGSNCSAGGACAALGDDNDDLLDAVIIDQDSTAAAKAPDDGDEDDEDDEGEFQDMFQETAAFGDLLDEYPTQELLLVGMASFRDKHLWFETQLDRIQVPWSGGHISLEVDRSDLVESGTEALLRQTPPQDMRQWMRVTFAGEPGVDVGGIEREWFVLTAQELFSPAAGLFVLTPGSSGYRLNPSGPGGFADSRLGFWADPLQLERCEFAGRVVGKAVLEKQSLPVSLTTSLLKHLLQSPCQWSDLEALDPELAKHLAWLLVQPAEVVDCLDLDFTVTTTSSDQVSSDRKQRKKLKETEAKRRRTVVVLLGDSSGGAGGGGGVEEEEEEDSGGDGCSDDDEEDEHGEEEEEKGTGGGGWGSGDTSEAAEEEEDDDARLLGREHRPAAASSASPVSSSAAAAATAASVALAMKQQQEEQQERQKTKKAKSKAKQKARSKPAVVVHELKPGGCNVAVTAANRVEYVVLLAKWHLATGVEAPLFRFLEGFYTVVPPDLLTVFDYAELEFLMCGNQTIDVQDWKRHTEYAGEYNRGGFGHAPGERLHPVVVWFWEVVEQCLDEGERARLFQFATGGGRVPAQGFKALQRNDGKYQRFCLESADPCSHAAGGLWLPTSHTCFNRLDLPLFKSKKELEEALRIVVNLDVTGFSMD